MFEITAFLGQIYKTSRYFSLDFREIVLLSKLTKPNQYWFVSKATYFHIS